MNIEEQRAYWELIEEINCVLHIADVPLKFREKLKDAALDYDKAMGYNQVFARENGTLYCDAREPLNPNYKEKQ